MLILSIYLHTFSTILTQLIIILKYIKATTKKYK